jgi:hypothetical protein
LVALVVLRAHEALGVLLVNSCHDLSANFGLGAFRYGVILQCVLAVIHVGTHCLDVSVRVVYPHHGMNHTIVVSLAVIDRSHHTVLDLGMLVPRGRS